MKVSVKQPQNKTGQTAFYIASKKHTLDNGFHAFLALKYSMSSIANYKYILTSHPQQRERSPLRKVETMQIVWPQNYRYLVLCACINRGYMNQRVLNNL